ncbi:MAG: peptidyl-prolyl cis-trans isomerase [Lachnospiraceae bacterium]|nr:peptidyl-prolyl cis-trans isomerase [Lachnospiraceae bacterium]MDE6981451.1 peptidyl-prolyl cis-trans isomerase [Lachnospiraceae bacterium]
MRKRKGIWLAGALIISQLLSGCSIGGKEVILTSGMGNRDVFRIDGVTGSLTEAKVYLANYQNIYGKTYGIDLWEQKFQNGKLKRYVKDVALSEMTRIVCMDLLAKEQEISLTEEEMEDVKRAAKTYYDSLSQAEKSYTGASLSDLEGMYEDYALANKVYHVLTEGVNAEVSDDEARIMEAMQIYIKDESKAGEVKEKLDTGEDFAAVASNYNKKTAIEISFGRREMPPEVEEVAFELDDGEISDCISTEEGYYYIKCINKFNEELTDANKSNIVKAREKAAFDDVYEAFISELSSNLNEKVWREVDLVTDGSISTDSYFKTIDNVLDKASYIY